MSEPTQPEVTRQTYLYAMLARALREGPVRVHISDPKAPVTSAGQPVIRDDLSQRKPESGATP